MAPGQRPEYCPCENDMPDPCPACGATVEGNDPVYGICQARYPYGKPHPTVELVLIDKITGKILS